MTHASIFSGIGGPEVAAAMLGWDNAFHCEINPFGRAVFEYWFPNSVSYEDITKTDFREWRGKIDVLTGGFPCQPFSYAGRRGGRNDNRYLWPEMLRVIDEVRPAWVVGENVAGITTMVEGGVCTDLGGEAALFGTPDNLHRYQLRQSFTIERICCDLEHHGYSVQPMLIPAAAVGAPHRRDRVFIIAYAEDTHNDGCSKREYAEQRDKRDKRDFGSRDTERVCGEARTVTANADGDADKANAGNDAGKGRATSIRQRDKVQLPGESGDVRSTAGGAVTDTNLQRCVEPKSPKITRISERLAGKAHLAGAIRGLDPETKWAAFPTVSAVHRGNDGLSFSLDDISISANKWRNESLKAYGNAIVPQVMYRIFQAIEQLNTKDNGKF